MLSWGKPVLQHLISHAWLEGIEFTQAAAVHR